MGIVQRATSYPVTVDYDRGPERMIKDGKYDWANSDITEKNFAAPTVGRRWIGAVEIHPDQVGIFDRAHGGASAGAKH